VIGAVGGPLVQYTVVGVAQDFRYSSLRQAFLPIVFVDMDQIPDSDSAPNVVVRTAMPLASASDAVSRAIAEIDPMIAMRYRSMPQVIDRALDRERLMATLSVIFGVLAVLIATVGLYGVMSYVVARRRVEIGVRMALGAEGRRVQRMVVGQAARLVIAGLAIGIVLTTLAGRTAAALLFGVQPSDPAAIAVAFLGLSAVALAAAWLPAHRASRLDPTVALREE
jgi:putative ABC transport system permease protein